MGWREKKHPPFRFKQISTCDVKTAMSENERRKNVTGTYCRRGLGCGSKQNPDDTLEQRSHQ
jgi:hypothetical protein